MDAICEAVLELIIVIKNCLFPLTQQQHCLGRSDFFCSSSGRQLLPWVWGARLLIHGYIFHRQRPKNYEKQLLRTHKRPKTENIANDNLPHSFKGSLYKIYKKKKILYNPVLTYMEPQDRVLMINTWSGYFRFTASVSSSFKTNFFLRASEIREAESSSLRDVQPLLYLQWHPPKNTNHVWEGIQCYFNFI